MSTGIAGTITIEQPIPNKASPTHTVSRQRGRCKYGSGPNNR